MTENVWYVYRHIRLDKNEPFYIGIGQQKNYARAYQVKSRNKYWKNIVSHTEYEVEIIMEGLSKQEAINKEIEFIALYGRFDICSSGSLCNMTDGGEGTVAIVCSDEKKRILSEKNQKYRHTPEAKKRISQAAKNISEETRRKMSESRKGKKRSPETIEKMRLAGANISEETRQKRSAALTGRKMSEEARLKMSLSAKERCKRKKEIE